VLANGTIDATQTKNVNGVLLLPSAVRGQAVFCVDVNDLAMPVRNVISTGDVNRTELGGPGFALVATRNTIPAIAECPAPFVDATVVTMLEEQGGTQTPEQFPIPFYVAFNR
jgi:hypothetical protein